MNRLCYPVDPMDTRFLVLTMEESKNNVNIMEDW